MWTARAITGASLLMLALPAIAQQKERPLEVSPSIGYLFGGTIGNLDLGCPTGFSCPKITTTLHDHVGFGLRIGYKLTGHWEPEILWTRTDTGVDNSIFGRQFPLTVDYVLGGLTYNFGRTGTYVRPYINASVGAARLGPVFIVDAQEGPRRGNEVRFSGSVALGVKTFVTPAWGFRLEARAYDSHIANSHLAGICTNFFGSVGEPVYQITGACPTRDWLVNGEMSGGLVLAF